MTMTEQVTMNIKPEAAAKLSASIGKNKIVLLALNDGSNKYSKMGGTCTIGANFQFVIVAKPDKEYSIKIDNNLGLDMYTSPAEMGFLGSQLVVNARNATLSLADDSGVIDGGMTISEYEPAEVTAKDMQEGKTC